MSDTDTFRTPDALIEEDEPSREELLELIKVMTRDWVKLNEFLNATAVYYNWCSSYEGRLTRYNKSFEHMSLEGRETRLPVRSPLIYGNNVDGCTCSDCRNNKRSDTYPLNPIIQQMMTETVTPQRVEEEVRRVMLYRWGTTPGEVEISDSPVTYTYTIRTGPRMTTE